MTGEWYGSSCKVGEQITALLVVPFATGRVHEARVADSGGGVTATGYALGTSQYVIPSSPEWIERLCVARACFVAHQVLSRDVLLRGPLTAGYIIEELVGGVFCVRGVEARFDNVGGHMEL